MTSYKGFPPESERDPRIPAEFFTRLLPHIDTLPELTITLYAFWRLARVEGTFRYLQLDDFTQDQILMANLGDTPQKALSTLKSALTSTVERGTLLKTEINTPNKPLTLYFLNNQPGQDAVNAIESGKWKPSPEPNTHITLDLESPNIFRLYEQHIGPLTPMLAEALQDAEKEYPPDWIEKALLEAVKNNVRKWTYVEAILRTWKEEGKHARRDKKDPQEDRRKYVQGKFSDSIEH